MQSCEGIAAVGTASLAGDPRQLRVLEQVCIRLY